MGIVNLNPVPVVVLDPQQRTVDKHPLVALVIRHGIVSRRILVDLQIQAILAVVIFHQGCRIGLLLDLLIQFGVLPEIVDGTVPVQIPQVGGTVYDLLLHMLDEIVGAAGPHMHIHPQVLAQVILGICPLGEIGRVEHQLHREGVGG